LMSCNPLSEFKLPQQNFGNPIPNYILHTKNGYCKIIFQKDFCIVDIQ
jgi:hypothetical protein